MPLAAMLVRTGILAGQRFILTGTRSTLGGGEHNQVRLPDPSVAQTHARLELREGVWLLTPLADTPGTRVDGVIASGEEPLSPGSTIHLGQVALLFEPRDGPEHPPGPGRRSWARAAGRFILRVAVTIAVLLGALLLLSGDAAGFIR